MHTLPVAVIADLVRLGHRFSAGYAVTSASREVFDAIMAIAEGTNSLDTREVSRTAAALFDDAMRVTYSADGPVDAIARTPNPMRTKVITYLTLVALGVALQRDLRSHTDIASRHAALLVDLGYHRTTWTRGDHATA